MNTLCLFASYFSGNSIPYYVQVYLRELKKQYTNVVFLHPITKFTEQSLAFLKKENISSLEVENEGFDFGKWYKAFQLMKPETYDQVALVNDSCVLFKSLDEFTSWAIANTADVKGITRSNAIYPHIQSYYLLLNKQAVLYTQKYFDEHKVLTNIADVISVYEVGLSKYLQEKGLRIAAYMDNNAYEGEFSPYYQCIDYHLEQGIPTIKKKIVFASYRKDELFTLARMKFNISWPYYKRKISKLTNKIIIDLDALDDHNEKSIGAFQRLQYTLQSLMIRLFRPFYKLLKGA